MDRLPKDRARLTMNLVSLPSWAIGDSGANWNRPDKLKILGRVVVGRLAT